MHQVTLSSFHEDKWRARGKHIQTCNILLLYPYNKSGVSLCVFGFQIWSALESGSSLSILARLLAVLPFHGDNLHFQDLSITFNLNILQDFKHVFCLKISYARPTSPISALPKWLKSLFLKSKDHGWLLSIFFPSYLELWWNKLGFLHGVWQL